MLDASSCQMMALAGDICMHIAAMKPLAVSQDELDSKVVERERDLADS